MIYEQKAFSIAAFGINLYTYTTFNTSVAPKYPKSNKQAAINSLTFTKKELK
jgi:hypothetical protein